MAFTDQLRPKRADRVEARHVRQLLVVDGEVDVQAAFRRRRNAFIEAGVHVDDGIDAEVGEGSPFADGGGDKQLSLFVNAVEIDLHEHDLRILQQSLCAHGAVPLRADDEVIDQLDVDERKRLLDPFRERQILG